MFTLESEEYLCAAMVTKINKRGNRQERVLLVSTNAIYNLKGKNSYKVNRRIRLSDIGAVTNSETGHEFVVHVPEEYD
jgi:hypothetical protein